MRLELRWSERCHAAWIRGTRAYTITWGTSAEIRKWKYNRGTDTWEVIASQQRLVGAFKGNSGWSNMLGGNYRYDVCEVDQAPGNARPACTGGGPPADAAP